MPTKNGTLSQGCRLWHKTKVFSSPTDRFYRIRPSNPLQTCPKIQGVWPLNAGFEAIMASRSADPGKASTLPFLVLVAVIVTVVVFQ